MSQSGNSIADFQINKTVLFTFIAVILTVYISYFLNCSFDTLVEFNDILDEVLANNITTSNSVNVNFTSNTIPLVLFATKFYSYSFLNSYLFSKVGTCSYKCNFSDDQRCIFSFFLLLLSNHKLFQLV